MHVNFRKIYRRIFKISGYILLAIILLLLLIKLAIQIPLVQNQLKKVVTSTLSEQLKNDVSIEKLYLKFPKKLAIQKLLITESNADTLVYIEEFSLNLRILPLLKHQIIIQEIKLANGQGDIGKLMESMDSEPAAEPTEETTSPSWDILLNQFTAENCYFNFIVSRTLDLPGEKNGSL